MSDDDSVWEDAETDASDASDALESELDSEPGEGIPIDDRLQRAREFEASLQDSDRAASLVLPRAPPFTPPQVVAQSWVARTLLRGVAPGGALSVMQRRQLRLCAARSLETASQHTRHRGAVHNLTYAPTGSALVAARGDGTLTVYDPITHS